MPHKTLTRAEVAKNNTEDSLWFIIDSKVYDASDFKDAHPGGEAVLKQGEAYSYAYLAFLVWKTRHLENVGGTLKVELENVLIGDITCILNNSMSTSILSPSVRISNSLCSCRNRCHRSILQLAPARSPPEICIPLHRTA